MKPPVPGVRPVPVVKTGDIISVEIPALRFLCVAEALGYPDDCAGHGEFAEFPKGTGWYIEMNVLGGPFIEKGYSYWKQPVDGGILTNLSRIPIGAIVIDRITDEPFRVTGKAVDDDGRAIEMALESVETGAALVVSKDPPKHNPIMEWTIGFVQFGLEYSM